MSHDQLRRNKLAQAFRKYRNVVKALGRCTAANVAREAAERRRKRIASAIIADFLAHTKQPAIGAKYDMNSHEVWRTIRAGTTEEQRREVWKFHHRETEREYQRRKRAKAIEVSERNRRSANQRWQVAAC